MAFSNSANIEMFRQLSQTLAGKNDHEILTECKETAAWSRPCIKLRKTTRVKVNPKIPVQVVKMFHLYMLVSKASTGPTLQAFLIVFTSSVSVSCQP